MQRGISLINQDILDITTTMTSHIAGLVDYDFQVLARIATNQVKLA